MLAVIDDGEEVVVRLHDTVFWVAATLSRPMAGHVRDGVIDEGDLVLVDKSCGFHEDLHIVSLPFTLNLPI